MFCKNCGKEMKDGSAFCSECGTKNEQGTTEVNTQIDMQLLFSLLCLIQAVLLLL